MEPREWDRRVACKLNRMVPDRYTSSFEGRKRLPPRSFAVSRKGQFPIWFGAIFVGVGIYIGFMISHPDPHGSKGDWIGWSMAASFFLFGLLFMWGGVRSWIANFATKSANEPAMGDFNWHGRKSVASRFQKLGPTLAFAFISSVFLGGCAAHVFGIGGGRGEGIFIRLTFVVMLGLPIFLWLRAIEQACDAFRFGSTWVAFTQFPYEIDQPVTLRWITPKKVIEVTCGVFILRCIEEYTEVTYRGTDRTHTIVHDEIWSSEWHFDHAYEMKPGEPVELEFILPEAAEPTSMHGDGPAVFWELDVRLILPGPDFSATYLIPIY